ncbi:MAG TPA: phosphoribosylformylglycinamidine synthase subunit PurQ [Syntrophorhabdaceae bacterium]|nr:phosphoribosylformylglycinamidine synthase subunit PurQ [Syntrophorhabdaceae bacterium]
MMKKRPKSLILFGNGINCENETAHANSLAGFEPELVHIDELTDRPALIHRFSFINFPGGFLDGDDLGSARAQAVKWKYQKIGGTGGRFLDELVKFVQEGKIIIGICNGFQLLIKTGLLPALGGSCGRQSATLTSNDSGRFEDRWVYLRVNRFSHCIFTKDMDNIYLPVRHGEGKCVVDTPEGISAMKEKGHIVLQYADESGKVTMEYPDNPNGSTEAIAALCDDTGRVFGLMPHPEAFVHRTQHPRWTRGGICSEGDGLKIFMNACKYITES